MAKARVSSVNDGIEGVFVEDALEASSSKPTHLTET